VVTLSKDHWSRDIEATVAVSLLRGLERGLVILACGP
jgi:hypothetical protein